MAITMCLNSRLNDRHRDKPEGVPLLSDLPARSVFADTVPAFLAVPVDVACCIAIPTFDVSAPGAGERASIEVLDVGIDASSVQYRIESQCQTPAIARLNVAF
jgi:hypothetical protein